MPFIVKSRGGHIAEQLGQGIGMGMQGYMQGRKLKADLQEAESMRAYRELQGDHLKEATKLKAVERGVMEDALKRKRSFTAALDAARGVGQPGIPGVGGGASSGQDTDARALQLRIMGSQLGEAGRTAGMDFDSPYWEKLLPVIEQSNPGWIASYEAEHAAYEAQEALELKPHDLAAGFYAEKALEFNEIMETAHETLLAQESVRVQDSVGVEAARIAAASGGELGDEWTAMITGGVGEAVTDLLSNMEQGFISSRDAVAAIHTIQRDATQAAFTHSDGVKEISKLLERLNELPQGRLLNDPKYELVMEEVIGTGIDGGWKGIDPREYVARFTNMPPKGWKVDDKTGRLDTEPWETWAANVADVGFAVDVVLGNKSDALKRLTGRSAQRQSQEVLAQSDASDFFGSVRAQYMDSGFGDIDRAIKTQFKWLVGQAPEGVDEVAWAQGELARRSDGFINLTPEVWERIWSDTTVPAPRVPSNMWFLGDTGRRLDIQGDAGYVMPDVGTGQFIVPDGVPDGAPVGTDGIGKPVPGEFILPGAKSRESSYQEHPEDYKSWDDVVGGASKRDKARIDDWLGEGAMGMSGAQYGYWKEGQPIASLRPGFMDIPGMKKLIDAAEDVWEKTADDATLHSQAKQATLKREMLLKIGYDPDQIPDEVWDRAMASTGRGIVDKMASQAASEAVKPRGEFVDWLVDEGKFGSRGAASRFAVKHRKDIGQFVRTTVMEEGTGPVGASMSKLGAAAAAPFRGIWDLITTGRAGEDGAATMNITDDTWRKVYEELTGGEAKK